LILTLNNPKEIYNFYNYINWPTIRALFILLLLTTAIKMSNFFDILAIKFITIFKNEKTLALFFIILTSILAMFLTNDITLFIVVPITLSISHVIKNDITKIIIFEAISANVGSLLTPIGNPQNLYLFREWHISFMDFINIMMPIFLIKFLILLLFAIIIFPLKKIEIKRINNNTIQLFLFIISFLFFIAFIVELNLNFVRYLTPIIIISFLFIKKEVLLEMDWFLILTFVLMFIDFNIIADINIVKNFINSFNLDFFNVMNISVILSQFISNVPAAIFMTQFSNNYEAIAYGSNIAGSGFILASLANIIAMRMLNDNKAYLTFHKFSLPYFFTSYGVILFLFFDNCKIRSY